MQQHLRPWVRSLLRCQSPSSDQAMAWWGRCRPALRVVYFDGDEVPVHFRHVRVVYSTEARLKKQRRCVPMEDGACVDGI